MQVWSITYVLVIIHSPVLKGRSCVPVGSVLLQKTSPNHGQQASGTTGLYVTLLQTFTVEHPYLVRSGVQLLTTVSTLNGQTTTTTVMLYTEELTHWHLSALLPFSLLEAVVFCLYGSPPLCTTVIHCHHLSAQPYLSYITPSLLYDITQKNISLHNSWISDAY